MARLDRATAASPTAPTLIALRMRLVMSSSAPAASNRAATTRVTRSISPCRLQSRQTWKPSVHLFRVKSSPVGSSVRSEEAVEKLWVWDGLVKRARQLPPCHGTTRRSPTGAAAVGAVRRCVEGRRFDGNLTRGPFLRSCSPSLESVCSESASSAVFPEPT